MKRSKAFEAEDGTTFVTAGECKVYENAMFTNKLIGLTGDDIDSALSREDIDLANALERAGNIIAAKRRESGERKRVKKGVESDVNKAGMDKIKEKMKVIS